MLDMESRLQAARMIMYGSLAVVFLIAIPWVGPWILLPLAASVLSYAGLKPFIARSARPEYPLAATVVNAQVLIGVAVAITGGPLSPAIPILLLPVVTLPARFPTRGVVAVSGSPSPSCSRRRSGPIPAAFADDPTYTLVALAAIFGLAAFAHTLMSSEMQQRADATIDPLTGLFNRNALATRFTEIAEQAARSAATGSRSSNATSTTSSASTISTATTAGTPCSRTSPRRCAATCARSSSCTASAARSS